MKAIIASQRAAASRTRAAGQVSRVGLAITSQEGDKRSITSGCTQCVISTRGRRSSPIPG